jgi:hypothetical protein
LTNFTVEPVGAGGGMTVAIADEDVTVNHGNGIGGRWSL